MNTRVTVATLPIATCDGRRLRALIAAETLDRQNEVLLASGALLDAYRRNPVLLWAHNAQMPPIGKATALEVEPGVGVWAENEFAPTPFAQELLELYRGGFLNAFSVGFRPLTVERKHRADGQRGTVITRWELIEQSAVAVPANPDALVAAAADGNKAADWLLKTYYPTTASPSCDPRAAGSPWPLAKLAGAQTKPKGTPMEDLIQELRTIAEQMRRDHDPDRVCKALGEVLTKAPTGPSRLAALDAAAADGPTLSLKSLLARPARDGRERELQRLNDRVYLASVLLRQDPRRLKSYRDFAALGGELRKALNTVDNDEFVPDGFSVSLIEEVRLQRRLPLLFEHVSLPRSPLRWPVEGGIGLPYLVGEPSGDTPDKVPTRAVGTAEVTFNARTIGVRVPFSHEFDEDSIIAAEDYVRRQIAKALTDGLEAAILNGDTASEHMDAVVTAGNDVRRTFHGLRRLAKEPTVATETDCATFDQASWVAVRQKLGAYGIDPGELVCVMGVKAYYKLLGDAAGWADFQTLDKVGPQAINLTGEVGALYGVPVVVSPYMPETCSNASVDDGEGSDSLFLIANRRAFGLATQVGPTIETLWDPESLQYKVIGYQRVDFKPWFSAATERCVSVGWNIDVA